MSGCDEYGKNLNWNIFALPRRVHITFLFLLIVLCNVAYVSVDEECKSWMLLSLADFENYFNRQQYEIPIEGVVDFISLRF